MSTMTHKSCFPYASYFLKIYVKSSGYESIPIKSITVFCNSCIKKVFLDKDAMKLNIDGLDYILTFQKWQNEHA